MRIETKNLIFEVNELGNQARFIAPVTGMQWSPGDFWQLSLHDRENNVDEFNINSSEQSGASLQDDGGAIRIVYDHLTDTYGDVLDIRLEVIIWKEGELIQFKTRVENRQHGVRVLESRCPVLNFNRLCGEPEQDVLYMPDGLGRRIRNPWAYNAFYQQGLNDYARSSRDYIWRDIYPGNACMAWMGIETGGKFLYIGRHDEKIRLCVFQVKVPYLQEEPRKLTITSAHLPAALPGETVETAATAISLLDGDWREGARLYRQFAQSTFYKPRPKKDWVRRLQGFCRINRQGPLDKYKRFPFEELINTYLEGRKYGIDSILLFGWWDSPFDTDYPNHEISPENAESLKNAIRKVRQLGGRVIIECNATYVNLQTPYFEENGREVAHLDLFGNMDYAYFGWAKDSVWRATNPYRRFVHGCCGSKTWRDTLIEHAVQMKALEPDSIFFDCFGAWSCNPCYNARHEHGARVDEQWEGRRKVYEAVRDICGDEQVFSNEVITDIAASYTQFIHSLVKNTYNADSDFPEMFRYTFPDIVITNRYMDNESAGFDKQLRWDFMLGMRYDVGEIGRFSTEREGGPRYAQIIGEMNSLRSQYAEFMMDGLFTVHDTTILPKDVHRAEYLAEDGRLLRILYNTAEECREVSSVTLKPDEMRFDVFPPPG